MKNHVIVLERKCWSNEQYSRCECLEISGILSDTEAGELDQTVLNVFEKLDIDVDQKMWKIVTGLKLKIVLRK